jgi:hypothetical protein
MSETWREKSKSRFKKKSENFFNFTDEETTFDVQEARKENHQLEQPSEQIINVAKTQPERSHNVDISQPERSQQPGHNVAIDLKTQPERSQEGRQNVAKTQPKRSQQPGQNVAIDSTLQTCDPTLLVGTQRMMFKYFINISQQFASRQTPRLTLDAMTSATGLRDTQIHSATKQLRQKGCIVLSGRKDGRGGWVEYSVNQTAFDLWIRLENSHKRSQNVDISQPERSQQPGHKAIHNSPCSSSNLNIKENTTTADPELWLSVPKNLAGLVQVKQLREFIRQGLVTEEVMQTTLDGFAYDLENGAIKARTGNPIAILIGAIKQGGYVSQKYLEELKAQLAEVEKTRTEMQKIQAQSVTEQLKEEFETFRQSHPELAEKFKPSEKFFKAFEPGSIGYKLWIDEYKTQKDLVLLRDEPEPQT